MRIFKGPDGSVRPAPSALTIGNFDGVHAGHLEIIELVRARAAATQTASTVLTFEPHPQLVLRGTAPAALVTFERKAELLEEAGVDQLVVLTFDRSLAAVEPEDFVERFVEGMLGARAVVVGANFRFGRMARGDLTMLATLGKAMGFSVEGVGIRSLEGRSISSTEIRHALSEGSLEWANAALGRPHRVQGRVIRGEGRGRGLGYPTANISPVPGICLPSPGIYAGWAVLEEERHRAAVSLGTNPTFGGGRLSLEAHLLDFEGSIYGATLAVDFVARLRAEAAFEDASQLAAAIEADVEAARAVLASGEGTHEAE